MALMRITCSLLVLLLLTACASASANRPLRVMTYNIHAGRDAAQVDNLERVAALIASSGADIVLLQEVDRNTKRSLNVDHFARFEEMTKLRGVFGKSLDFQGGEYGIAILSRWPVTVHEVVHLPVEPPQTRAGGSVEPRVALVADIDAPSGPLRVINTHFDASGEDLYRLQEVETLAKVIGRVSDRKLIVGGDFNSNPDSAIAARMKKTGLRDAWLECGVGADLTYPANVPVKRIDYLYLSEGLRCRSATVPDSQGSDHRAVVAVVR